MNYLLFFVHPSKINVFRKTINTLKNNGHKVDILITTKDVLEDLVRKEGWEYTNIFPEGRKMKNVNPKISAAINTFRTYWRIKRYLKNKKYDLFITDDLLGVNGKFQGVPTLLLQDDDVSVVPESQLLMFFSDYILSPSVSNMKFFNSKKIPFFGYKELGGLHPNIFKPDIEKVKKFNSNLETYFILRLVSLRAVHDGGKKGLDNEDTLKLIEILEKHGKVFITAERELPIEFEKYRIQIPSNEIAHAISFAKLMISDSQTMSAEAGVLGTPYIRFNDFVGRISYLEELEKKYELGIGIKTNEKEKLFDVVNKLLSMSNLQEIWDVKRENMLAEKIDLSAFLIWLIENYPSSAKTILENEQYQLKFK